MGGGGGGKIDTDSLPRKGSLPLLPWASEGELRKLLSLSLSPHGSAGVGWQLRKERGGERFFKRAGGVGAAVWLCLALEAGRDGQGSFGDSRIV